MHIICADKHIWVKKIEDNILGSFGKNNTTKLNKLYSSLPSTTITYKIEELTREHLDWFIPLYNAHIATKTNPHIFNIMETTIGKTIIEYPYSILYILESGTPIGGIVFTTREDRISIAYRTFINKWAHHTFNCSPALYAERVIAEYALHMDKQLLVHGKDRNPYGLHSSIGVAIFKLSVGCHPQVPKKFDLHTVYVANIKTDALILEYPKDEGAIITKGYLIATAESAQTWIQATKYPEVLNVEVIIRPN